VMPSAHRMNCTLSTTQFDIEHDQKSPRTASKSERVRQESARTLSTKNDTTTVESERSAMSNGHIKVGSSMILNMQRATPFHKTTCCDLLVSGYLRSSDQRLFDSLPLDIFPVLCDFLDPLLKWVLERSEPHILSMAEGEPNHLFLRKNEWKRLSNAMKFIVHDVVLSRPPSPYTVCIHNDSHFGSNILDIQWLCQMLSTNLALKSLRISHCKNLVEFKNFHFLLQHGFLLQNEAKWRHLEELSIDSAAGFNDECFALMAQVIAAKCPALQSLSLRRTAISGQSVEALLALMEHNECPALWDIDISFCRQIDAAALGAIARFLQRVPTKRVHFKCTAYSLSPGRPTEDQRLSLSIYPT